MIDSLILFVTLVAYFFGYPAVAFWMIVFAILNGVFAIVRVILNPDWYHQQWAAHMGHEVSLEPRKIPVSFFVTKAILIGLLVFFAWWVRKSI